MPRIRLRESCVLPLLHDDRVYQLGIPADESVGVFVAIRV